TTRLRLAFRCFLRSLPGRVGHSAGAEGCRAAAAPAAEAAPKNCLGRAAAGGEGVECEESRPPKGSRDNVAVFRETRLSSCPSRGQFPSSCPLQNSCPATFATTPVGYSPCGERDNGGVGLEARHDGGGGTRSHSSRACETRLRRQGHLGRQRGHRFGGL